MTMIGHNNPPSDPQIMREMLEQNNAKAIDRAQKLIEAADRVPPQISDMETSNKITDLEKQIKVCRKAIEDGRVKDKAPYLDLCRTVDDFFRPHIETMDGAIKRIKGIQTKFLVEEEAKERARRAELARQEQAERDRLADEAAKLEAEGKKSQAEATIDRAIQHDHDAAFFTEASQQTGSAVAASTGELTGARSSLRYTWTGEILNRDELDLEALRPYLPADALQKALNAFVKANKGTRQIKGAKIWEKPDVMTR